MKKNDRQDGQGAKTINVWTIVFIVQWSVFCRLRANTIIVPKAAIMNFDP
jgi:hypothetical protein